MTFVQTNERQYWVLAGSLWRAGDDPGDDFHYGYYNALKTACEDAVAFAKEDAIRLVRERAAGIAPEMTGVPDPYRNGYVAGCERAIRVMEGSE
jgi:hypothetical protein